MPMTYEKIEGGLFVKLKQNGAIQTVVHNRGAPAALKAEGSVVAWDVRNGGGDCSKMLAQIAIGVQGVHSATYSLLH